ncbi:hypothetical protein RFI_12989, partial [Reticulomyxa filosa]
FFFLKKKKKKKQTALSGSQLQVNNSPNEVKQQPKQDVKKEPSPLSNDAHAPVQPELAAPSAPAAYDLLSMQESFLGQNNNESSMHHEYKDSGLVDGGSASNKQESTVPAPPPPDEYYAMVISKKGDHSNGAPNKPLNVSKKAAKVTNPLPDEFDYEVVFTESVLGMELSPDPDGKNCIVTRCMSEIAKAHVDPGSLIISINDVWVAGLSYDAVRDTVKSAAKHPPLTITFREKVNRGGGGHHAEERGYLKVKVVAGIQLRHPGSYAVVQVGSARLSTHTVTRNEHPEWNEMITFKNFRPDPNKSFVFAVISITLGIFNLFFYSVYLIDKLIGQAEFHLPLELNKLQRDTLDLISSKGKLAGVIVLNSIIVSRDNTVKHLKKF